MLKKILGTAGTRVLNAIITFALLFVITRNLGREGMGTIGLILLDINIIQLFIDLFAGSSLIYMASRTSIANLLFISYTWIVMAIVFFAFLFSFLGGLFPAIYHTVVPVGYELRILVLTTISAYMLTHYNLLLGKERIKTYNIFFTIQAITLFVSFLFLIYVRDEKTVGSYITALYISYAAGAIVSFDGVLHKEKNFRLFDLSKVAKELFNFGLVTSVANILHIGNKRVGYYFIRYFAGLSSLGLYAAGTQLTEGLKLIGQSISLVQFSTLSNMSDKKYAKDLTIKLMKVSVVLTLFALLILFLIPVEVYVSLFGIDFAEVKPVIILLSPGVIALSSNTVFAHYFSGMGNPKINLYSNAVGFVVVLILAITLIPFYGFYGAAIAVSVSYLISMVYNYTVFKKQTGAIFAELIPKYSDVVELRQLFNEITTKVR